MVRFYKWMPSLFVPIEDGLGIYRRRKETALATSIKSKRSYAFDMRRSNITSSGKAVPTAVCSEVEPQHREHTSACSGARYRHRSTSKSTRMVCVSGYPTVRYLRKLGIENKKDSPFPKYGEALGYPQKKGGCRLILSFTTQASSMTSSYGCRCIILGIL